MKRRSLFPPPVPPAEAAASPHGAPRIYTFVAFVLLALVIASAWRTVDSSSVLMHLKIGERISELRQVPQRDFLSVASDTDTWTYPEWGWGLILAQVYHFQGWEWRGISGLGVLCVAATASLMFVRGRRRGAKVFENLVTIGAVLAALMPAFQTSPDRLAHVLFVLALIAGESRRLRALTLLPLISLIWANVHPGFVLPGAIAFARLIFPPPDEQGQPGKSPNAYLFVIIISCIAAVLINPRSLQIAQVPYAAVVDGVLNPEVLLEGDVLLKLAIASGLIIVTAAMRAVYKWEILLGAGMLITALVSVEALDFLLVYLAAPAAVGLSRILAATWSVRRVRHAAGGALTLAVVAVLASAIATEKLTSDAFGAGIRKNIFPETAAGRLASLPVRNSILNLPQDGGYLAWRTWPAWNITMDERPRLYSPEQREQYDLLWQGGQGWEKLLTQWRVNAVLGSPEIAELYPDHNLYYKLAQSNDWAPVYWDRFSILYVQNRISLRDSNLTAFRVLKPGLTWAAMTSNLSTPKQWRDLAADLRRVLSDDSANRVAAEFLSRAEEKIATLE